MANPPPPYSDITGISRTVMKDNAQETLSNYNGNARPGEIVADLTTDPPALYIGNNLGQLTALAGGGGGGLPLANGTSNLNIATVNGNVTVTVAGTDTWSFDTAGTLTAPGNLSLGASSASQINTVPNSSGDGNGYTTLQLIPDETLTGTDQYLIIDPTSPGHIHIRAGGTQDNSSADLMLGGENSYFVVPAGSNVSISVVANSNVWTFGSDGTLSTPGTISATGNITTDTGYITGNNIDAATRVSGAFMQFNVSPLNNLPSPSGNTGLRGFANDANLVAAGNFGAEITDGGSNIVPVWSDGSVWRIG